MKKLITAQKAAKIIFVLFGSLLITHILIISGFLPYSLFWEGQIKKESVLPLELISIVFLFSFSLILLIKLKYLKEGQDNKMINIGLWFIALYFIFQTFSNFSSSIKIENVVLGTLSASISLLSIRLAFEK